MLMIVDSGSPTYARAIARLARSSKSPRRESQGLTVPHLFLVPRELAVAASAPRCVHPVYIVVRCTISTSVTSMNSSPSA